jgi:hypothetical protein
MNNFVAHIDGCTKLRESSFNDFNRAIHSSAKTSWLSKQNFFVHAFSLNTFSGNRAPDSKNNS